MTTVSSPSATHNTGLLVYRRSRLARSFDVLDALCYALYRTLRGLLRGSLVLAIPVGLYLAPIALLWGLYRVAAGYFLPTTWPVALRAPAFWPVVAGISFLALLLLAGFVGLRLCTSFRLRWRRLPHGVECTLYWRHSDHA